MDKPNLKGPLVKRETAKELRDKCASLEARCQLLEKQKAGETQALNQFRGGYEVQLKKVAELQEQLLAAQEGCMAAAVLEAVEANQVAVLAEIRKLSRNQKSEKGCVPMEAHLTLIHVVELMHSLVTACLQTKRTVEPRP